MDLLVAPRAQGGTSLAPGQSKPPTVLVVDRQPLFLQALRSLLSAPPLQAVAKVTTESDAVVRMASEGELDLVICDVLASPLNGRAVTTALAEVAPDVPLILLGEVAELASELPLLLEGATGMLTKDAAPEQLIAGVSAVLAGHRTVADSLLEPMLAMRSARPAGESRLTGQLSHAEREVLALLGEARSVPAIAKARGISQKTVRNHMASIYRKLELRNRAEAMLYAARNGMVVGAPVSNGEDRPRAQASLEA